MGWKPNHNRMRSKYNPKMNADELRHKDKVKRQPCYGCGRFGVHAHHTLLKFPEKRWRRDHDWLLPACETCHSLIHDYYGTEEAWLDSHEKTPDEAIEYMRYLHLVDAV